MEYTTLVIYAYAKNMDHAVALSVYPRIEGNNNHEIFPRFIVAIPFLVPA